MSTWPKKLYFVKELNLKSNCPFSRHFGKKERKNIFLSLSYSFLSDFEFYLQKTNYFLRVFFFQKKNWSSG